VLELYRLDFDRSNHSNHSNHSNRLRPAPPGGLLTRKVVGGSLSS
jgi:hypothetical protein